MKHIAIIWWGAAGLMAGATLAESSPQAEIHIFEKNAQLGSKIRISGWGRCNITTGFYKKQDLQTKYTRWRDLLSDAISQFGPRKMQQRCADHDCPIYCQDDMRCFPVSDKWDDVVAMFEKILRANNVQVHFTERVVSIVSRHTEKEATNTEKKSPFQITTSKETYDFDYVVITTWWNAYGKTGSTGDWYTLAQSLWHTITPIGPSLNSFLIAEERLKKCSGISLPNATLWTDEARVSWPILFTHFGISWPVTFALSSYFPYIEISEKEPKIIYCKPHAEYWYERWLKELTARTLQDPRKHLDKILEEHFPKRRVTYFLEIHFPYKKTQKSLTIPNTATIKLSDISNEQKKHLAALLGNGFPITLIARKPWDEFVSAWGVSTSEINPHTMESNICPWVYFAGEILDIDGVTWGFNFQAAWSTGRCAGKEIEKKILSVQ